MFSYWQSRLTDDLLGRIHADDGILVNLASGEMKRLFDWKRVCREARVITPEFRVREGDRLKTVVVYTKMCRGEMTRHILKNRIADPATLRSFEWEGFRLDRPSRKATTGCSRSDKAFTAKTAEFPALIHEQQLPGAAAPRFGRPQVDTATGMRSVRSEAAATATAPGIKRAAASNKMAIFTSRSFWEAISQNLCRKNALRKIYARVSSRARRMPSSS